MLLAVIFHCKGILLHLPEQGYVTEEKAEESKAGLNAHHGTQCRKHHGKYHKWHPHHHEHDGKCTCVTTTRKSYEYDENWQLTKCTDKTDNKARIIHSYAYDADGNRTHYTKQRPIRYQLQSIRNCL